MKGGRRTMSRKPKDRILVLREKDYPDGVIPREIAEGGNHVIMIKARQTRVGEEIRLKQKTEIPVLILEDTEEIELLEHGKLPVGVTDQTVVIIDDIGTEG
jgi:hypothetical protein